MTSARWFMLITAVVTFVTMIVVQAPQLIVPIVWWCLGIGALCAVLEFLDRAFEWFADWEKDE